MELRAGVQNPAVPREQALRLRHHHAWVIELTFKDELALSAHEAVHRVIEPVRVDSGLDARACGSFAYLFGRSEQGIDLTQFVVQKLEATSGSPPSMGAYTCAPTLESMKMLRRRNGAGECVSRYRRSDGSAEPNTGSDRPSILPVQVGTGSPRRVQAISTMAAT